MTNHRARPTRRPTRRAAALVAIAAGLLLPLAACERPTPAAQAIHDATGLMRTLAASASTPSAPDFARDQVYQRVLTTLEPIQSQGTPTEQGAIRVMLAQAQIGLGERPFTEAMEAHAAVLNDAAVARGLVASYARLSGQASALERFDPRDQLAELRERMSRLDRDQQEAERARNEVQARINQLRTEGDQRLAQAKTLRDRIGSARLEASRLSETEAAELMSSLRADSREADRLEMEAGDLLARAELTAPELTSANVAIARVEREREAIERARARAEATATRSAADARTARDQAAEVGRDLAAQLDRALQRLASDADPKVEEATGRFDRAVGLANQASRELRSVGNAATGQAQQFLARTHEQSAITLAELAALLENASTLEPAIPNAQRYATQARALRERAQAHRTAIGEARESAESAFAGAGLRDRAAATDFDTDAHSEAGTESGVRAFLQDMTEAVERADFDAIFASVIAEGPAMQRLLDELTPLLRAFTRLDRAHEDRFGRGVFEYLSSPEAAGTGSMLAGMAAAGDGGIPGVDVAGLMSAGGSPDDATIDVFGNEAMVTFPGMDEPMTLRFQGGRWVMVLSDDMIAEAGGPEALEPILTVLPAITSALNDTAARIERGQLESEQAALTAIEGQLMGAIMQLLSGGN